MNLSNYAVDNDWRTLDLLCSNGSTDLELICALLGRVLGVDQSCVGLLKVRGTTLQFVYPLALTTAGRIPLSSSAIAARTATTKRCEMFNNFAKTTHSSVFELVPLGGSAKTGADAQRIQKLMSAPVMDGARAVGVIQISRKGVSRDEAGPDFTDEDMEKLNSVAKRLAPLFETL
jgi:GAF domain